jgi:hypothetical protein
MTKIRAAFVGICLGIWAFGTAPPVCAIDVSGGWQVNIDCGLAATATSFLTLVGSAGGAVVEATTPECGTLEVPGEIVEILTCVHTPEPRVGIVSGSSIAIPSAGVFRNDATFEPFTFPFLLCPADRVVSEHRYVGTIFEDGSGVATQIAGTLINTLLQVYRPDGSVCLDIPDTLDCQFDMRRNEVAVGSNVAVSPRSGATVTFASVVLPGRAAVVPLTTPSATVPPSYTVVGEGGLPLYYDVKTTAVWSGAVELCLAYGDANDDGLVDQTGQSEEGLRLLHDEGGVFVDRTTSLDTTANVICAETASLSQLVLAGGPSQTAPPGCAVAPLGGCKRSLEPEKVMLQIKDKGSDRADKFQWKLIKGQSTAVGESGDPLNGEEYAICIYDESGLAPALIYAATVPSALTCGSEFCWKVLGSEALRYKSSSGAPEGARLLLLKPGADGKAQILLMGKGIHLGDGLLGFPSLPLPLPARVQLQGSSGVCWEAEYTSAGAQKNDPTQFKGRASGP